jgi:flagellar protein FlbD
MHEKTAFRAAWQSGLKGRAGSDRRRKSNASAPAIERGFIMIKLTRFDGSEVAVNAELVKFVEAAPDTIVTLTSDQKILVLETVDEVIDRVISYRKLAYCSLPEVRDRREETNEIEH